MSDLLVLGLKLLFLALLWLFVLFAINVIRTDLFGRKVPAPAVAGAVAAEPDQPRRRSRASRRASRRLPSRFRVTGGPQAGLALPLGDTFLIGRTPDAALVLDDQYMSTRHALLTRTPTGYVVEDLGSTNGTFLNDRRLTQPTPITSSDTLRIGRTSMTVGK